MTFSTLIDFNLQSVWVMTTRTSGETFHMGVLRIVDQAIIFIATVGNGAIKCGSSSEVMHVAETECYILAIHLDRSNHGIHISDLEGLVDLLIDTDFRLTTL